MTTITVQLPEEEATLLKQLLKKFKAKIISEIPTPNKATIAAMKELKEGKGIKVSSVDELLKLV